MPPEMEHPFGGARYVGYGAGGAFQNIVLHGLLPENCAYVVDRDFRGDAFEGVSVRRPDALEQEDRETPFVLFTMSSRLYSELRSTLINHGFSGENIHYYGDIFLDTLRNRVKGFGLDVDPAQYAFVQTVNALLGVDNHSSSMGSALLLAMQAETRASSGAMVELGVFRGGNALAVCLANVLLGDTRPYYLIDSFEGFPQLSVHDPAAWANMFRNTSYEEIVAAFAHFPRAHVIKGYVPEILSDLPDQRYSVVYYDCDLHDPAQASLLYFWPKLEPGGYVLIHDYLPKRDGFDGVRIAVDAFLDGRRDFEMLAIPETTHLILRKTG